MPLKGRLMAFHRVNTKRTSYNRSFLNLKKGEYSLERLRKPEWLKIKIRSGPDKLRVESVLERLTLHTVCEEAGCPNRMECFSRQTATFMILGKYCTRNCSFCNVENGLPEPVNPGEPGRVAAAVKELGLKHVVVTSVTRDDLPDGGAGHFAAVISGVRNQNPEVTIEVLIPDFQGNLRALKQVIAARPEIINHNIETVPRLYSEVRPQSVYQRSLNLLANIKEQGDSILTKSGIMLGLGETEPEIISALKDLRRVNCDFLTIGQYLAPSAKHHPVVSYIHPDVFKKYHTIGLEFGFKAVFAGPLVRSSYQADKMLTVEERANETQGSIFSNSPVSRFRRR
jgi:lipoic acid synthetase